MNAIADELLAGGEDSRIVSVQAALGGGNYSTFKRALDVWPAERGAAAPSLPVLDEIQGRCTNLVQML